jgi:hypothetical protein
MAVEVMLTITLPDFWAGVLAVIGLEVLALIAVAIGVTIRGGGR